MGKITLKYPDLNYLNPKIQVYLNGEEISEIKNGEEKNIELSSSGEIVFKSSFRKGILKVKKDCDYIISLQWGIFSGKLNPVIEDSSDEEILNESNNRRIKNNFSNGNILYIVLFIIAIIGISNSLGLFGSVSTEEKKLIGIWDNDLDRSITISKNGKCDLGSTKDGAYENLSCEWKLINNIIYITGADKVCMVVYPNKHTTCRNYKKEMEFKVNYTNKSMTRTDGARIYYQR